MKMPYERIAKLPAPQLPDGYTFAFYQDGNEQDWARLEASVNEFATEEKLLADLGVHRGSVSPFAYLNEDTTKYSAPLLIDQSVWNANRVKFHPCDNTATVVLTLDDFKKYLTSIGKKVIVVD
jgi:Ala-tRNA(Pro) deacylase